MGGESLCFLSPFEITLFYFANSAAMTKKKRKFNHILKKEYFAYHVQIQIITLAEHYMGKLRTLFVHPCIKWGSLCWFFKTGILFRRKGKKILVYFFCGTWSMGGWRVGHIISISFSYFPFDVQGHHYCALPTIHTKSRVKI